MNSLEKHTISKSFLFFKKKLGDFFEIYYLYREIIEVYLFG